MAKKKSYINHSNSHKKHVLHQDVPHIIAYAVLLAVFLFALYFANKVVGLY